MDLDDLLDAAEAEEAGSTEDLDQSDCPKSQRDEQTEKSTKTSPKDGNNCGDIDMRAGPPFDSGKLVRDCTSTEASKQEHGGSSAAQERKAPKTGVRSSQTLPKSSTSKAPSLFSISRRRSTKDGQSTVQKESDATLTVANLRIRGVKVTKMQLNVTLKGNRILVPLESLSQRKVDVVCGSEGMWATCGVLVKRSQPRASSKGGQCVSLCGLLPIHDV